MNSLENTNKLPLDLVYSADVLVVVLGLIFCAVLACRWWRPGGRPEPLVSDLLAVILIGILSNAALTGILSAPAERYGGRVIWLLPFFVVLYFIWLIGDKSRIKTVSHFLPKQYLIFCAPSAILPTMRKSLLMAGVIACVFSLALHVEAATFLQQHDLGSFGSDVATLQQPLKSRGYFQGSTTGYNGPLTKTAVTALRKANHMEPVGSLGPKTWDLLNRMVKVHKPPIILNPAHTGTTTPPISTTTPVVPPIPPGGGGEPSPPPPPPSPSCNLTATGAMTLTWTAQNGVSAAIDQGIGAVSSAGTTSIAPAQTSNYTISVTNARGSATCQAVATPPPQTITFGTYEHPYAKDSPWNIRPVNPVLSSIGTPASFWQPSVGPAEGMPRGPMYLAQLTDQPMVLHGYDTPANPETSGLIADPDGDNVRTLTIPHWPASVFGYKGDGWADIVDPANNIIYSLFGLSKDHGIWRVSLWGWTKLNGRGWGDPAHFYQGARATGIPVLGGYIRRKEINDGDIMYRHALTMSMPPESLAANPAYVFPATSADWDAGANTGGIPEGALVMLPSNFDVSSLGIKCLQKVACTLQTYGGYVTDKNMGTPYRIEVESGPESEAEWCKGDTSDSAYDDINKIREAMRMVATTSGWVDIDGNPVNRSPDGLPLLSLRGPWNIQGAATTTVKYNTLSQSVHFGPTGDTRVTVRNTSTKIPGLKMLWEQYVPGDPYRLTVHATRDAKMELHIVTGPNNEHEFHTGPLGDGQSTVFNWPSGGNDWLIPELTSGVNVPSSSVSIELVKVVNH